MEFQSALPARATALVLEEREGVSGRAAPRSVHRGRRARPMRRARRRRRTGRRTACVQRSMWDPAPKSSGRQHRRGHHFNPRPPRGGRPAARGVFQAERGVSIRAPRAGGDLRSIRRLRRWIIVSIRAPRAGGDLRSIRRLRRWIIVSIRAPRAGGDMNDNSYFRQQDGFNPRPPRGGRRAWKDDDEGVVKFQSAPPARGATPATGTGGRSRRFQSAPPARGATR